MTDKLVNINWENYTYILMTAFVEYIDTDVIPQIMEGHEPEISGG